MIGPVSSSRDAALDLDLDLEDDVGAAHESAALYRRSEALLAIHDRLSAVIALRGPHPELPLLRARNRVADLIDHLERSIARSRLTAISPGNARAG